MFLGVCYSFVFSEMFACFFLSCSRACLWPDGDGHDVCGARSRVVSLIKSQKFGVSDFGVLWGLTWLVGSSVLRGVAPAWFTSGPERLGMAFVKRRSRHPRHLENVTVCDKGPDPEAGGFVVDRGRVVPRMCTYSVQTGRCNFAHELCEVRAPGPDASGLAYGPHIFQSRISMYFGQEYLRKHRDAIAAWAVGVSFHLLPLWYHMWRWFEDGCENSERSLAAYGVDFGHEARKQEFQQSAGEYPAVLNEELEEKLKNRRRDWKEFSKREREELTRSKQEPVSEHGDQEWEPRAAGSDKRRRVAKLWYMAHVDPEPDPAWASRLAYARSCSLPLLSIDDRKEGCLQVSNKNEYDHVIKMVRYMEKTQKTEVVDAGWWRQYEHDFLRALFVPPRVDDKADARAEYEEPQEYGPARFLQAGVENVLHAVMGDVRPEQGVTRYIVVRRGFDQSRCLKYAHGTGGYGFLSIWADLVVHGSERLGSKVYAYPCLESVYVKEYAFFEHFGGGLWARIAVLLEGRFGKQGSSSTPPQWTLEGPLVPQGFVFELAPTHAV